MYAVALQQALLGGIGLKLIRVLSPQKYLPLPLQNLRNDRGQYLLWLTEAEANRLRALRRRGELYCGAVIRLARAHDYEI